MKFTKRDDQNYGCQSDSGSTYRIYGEPLPDEFDSAMRCGIPEDDEFVQAIPLVWRCDCPAGRSGRACKHLDEFFVTVLGHDRAEIDARHNATKARAAARRAGKRAEKRAAEEAEQRRIAERERYETARNDPECIAEARELLAPGTWIGPCARPSFAADRTRITEFEQKWGFFAAETRIAAIARNAVPASQE